MTEPYIADNTPEAFLNRVSEKLEQLNGVDVDLASVLAQHILIAEAADDAVTQAKAAVLAIAKARAEAPEEVLSD